jgi:hypothetical protein
MGAAL